MRGPVRALGLMSGTSLDGLDAAEIVTDGVDVLSFGAAGYRAYKDAEAQVLRRGFGSWPGEDAGRDAAITQVLGEVHASLAVQFPTAEVIGFHGQTLNHAPKEGRSFQIGDGAALAEACRRPVVWDFRAADVASGGEGAPLAPVYHHALARMLGLERPVGFLNIGGVANVTWVDPRLSDPGAPDAMLALDTGPGNALMNDFIAVRTGAGFDEGGGLAALGTVDEALVARFLALPFFALPAPKSLDRDAFAQVQAWLDGLSTEDGLATLAAMSVAGVRAAVALMPEPPERWLVCGGGRHNGALMRGLGASVNAPVDPVEAVGLDGDMLEAQAFAYLAVRVLRGLPTSFPGTTGCRVPVCGGRISHSG